LIGKAILVSGHHGTFIHEKYNDRFIIDASGGNPSLDSPIQALILPDRTIVNHYSKKKVHKSKKNCLIF